MDFSEKIRNAREDSDLSQEDVASKIPMSQSGYSKIERGVQEPSMYQLKRICEILKISADNLLSLNKFEDISSKDFALLKDIKDAFKKYSN